MSAVVMREVTKRYGERHVLRGIDLDVAEGEVVCILGPNGAGKTTTVEILEGYRTVTSGSVDVLGFDPATHPVALRQRIGVVLQECGFPNHLTVVELLRAWQAYYPTARPLDELLEVVELADEGNSRVRRLSGGQRRRLDFALALVGDPALVFLDEPTTGFDPDARQRCWRAIENLSALGKTVLLTTHYLDEAERLSDRVAILARGRIIAVGTPAELRRRAGLPTSVSFRLPPRRRRVPWPASRIDGDRLVIETSTPTATLREALAWADGRGGGELQDLAVTPPGLEASYSALLAAAEASTG